MDFYKQCKLIRNNTECTSWIPEQFAVVGKGLKLKDGQNWINGWVVKEVYSRLAENQLPNFNKDVRIHRKKTGDSLPKKS
jgi:hypothetical protein